MQNFDFKGIIFDLDGTLLNTIDSLGISMNNVLKAAGYQEHPIDNYKYYVGEGIEVLVKKALFDLGITDKEIIKTILDKMNMEYTKNLFNGVSKYTGIETLLNELENKKFSKSILSNKPHNFTIKVVSHFLSEWNFDYIYGARDGIAKKPDPVSALEIAENWNVAPDKILYVGDTCVDMQTGKGAGMFTIGVKWGFRPVDELVSHGADKIVENPEHILDFLF